MPPAPDPDAKIPCPTPQSLEDELHKLADVLEPPEREDTWEKFERAIIRFAGVTRGGGYKHVEVYVRGVGPKGIGLRIVDCMMSDRGRLSGVSTDLLQTLAPRLASSFAPLVNLYLPPLVRLLARPNKVYLKRSEKCLATILAHCQLPSILVHLRNGLDDKNDQCKRACATGLERIASDWDRSVFADRDVEMLEGCVRKMATDKDAEVRKTAKRVWTRFTQVWPERVDEFSAPLTPTVRRYLDIPQAGSNGNGPSKPGPSRTAAPRPALSSSTSTVRPQHQRINALGGRPAPETAPSASQHRGVVAESDADGHSAPSRAGPSRTVDPSRPSRSVSHATLSTLSSSTAPPLVSLPLAERANPLSKPVRIFPNSASMQTLSSTSEDASAAVSAPRRFAPPARIMRPIPTATEEDAGAGVDSVSAAGPQRGPVRPNLGASGGLGGVAKRPLPMGQAQRRVVTAPASTSASSSAASESFVTVNASALVPAHTEPPRLGRSVKDRIQDMEKVREEAEVASASSTPARSPRAPIAATRGGIDPAAVPLPPDSPTPLTLRPVHSSRANEERPALAVHDSQQDEGEGESVMGANLDADVGMVVDEEMEFEDTLAMESVPVLQGEASEEAPVDIPVEEELTETQAAFERFAVDDEIVEVGPQIASFPAAIEPTVVDIPIQAAQDKPTAPSTSSSPASSPTAESVDTIPTPMTMEDVEPLKAENVEPLPSAETSSDSQSLVPAEEPIEPVPLTTAATNAHAKATSTVTAPTKTSAAKGQPSRPPSAASKRPPPGASGTNGAAAPRRPTVPPVAPRTARVATAPAPVPPGERKSFRPVSKLNASTSSAGAAASTGAQSKATKPAATVTAKPTAPSTAGAAKTSVEGGAAKSAVAAETKAPISAPLPKPGARAATAGATGSNLTKPTAATAARAVKIDPTARSVSTAAGLSRTAGVSRPGGTTSAQGSRSVSVAAGSNSRATAQVTLPPRPERVRLKAPLPSFRPGKPAAPTPSASATASASQSRAASTSSNPAGKSAVVARVRPELIALPSSPSPSLKNAAAAKMKAHDVPLPPSPSVSSRNAIAPSPAGHQSVVARVKPESIAGSVPPSPAIRSALQMPSGLNISGAPEVAESAHVVLASTPAELASEPTMSTALQRSPSTSPSTTSSERHGVTATSPISVPPAKTALPILTSANEAPDLPPSPTLASSPLLQRTATPRSAGPNSSAISVSIPVGVLTSVETEGVDAASPSKLAAGETGPKELAASTSTRSKVSTVLVPSDDERDEEEEDEGDERVAFPTKLERREPGLVWKDGRGATRLAESAAEEKDLIEFSAPSRPKRGEDAEVVVEAGEGEGKSTSTITPTVPSLTTTTITPASIASSSRQDVSTPTKTAESILSKLVSASPGQSPHQPLQPPQPPYSHLSSTPKLATAATSTTPGGTPPISWALMDKDLNKSKDKEREEEQREERKALSPRDANQYEEWEEEEVVSVPRSVTMGGRTGSRRSEMSVGSVGSDMSLVEGVGEMAL